MPSNQIVNLKSTIIGNHDSDHTVLQKKAELFDELNIMLQEAGQRGSVEEASIVISAILSSLKGSPNFHLISQTQALWEQLQATVHTQPTSTGTENFNQS